MTLYQPLVSEDRGTVLTQVLAVVDWMGLYYSHIHAGGVGLLFCVDESIWERENKEKGSIEKIRVPRGHLVASIIILLNKFRCIRKEIRSQDLCGYCALISGELGRNILTVSEERSSDAWERWRDSVQLKFRDGSKTTLRKSASSCCNVVRVK